jgi:hypothetical protein
MESTRRRLSAERAAITLADNIVRLSGLASLDPARLRKTTGLILDLGHFVRPFITPDDPERVEAVIREHATLVPSPEEGGRRPFV